MAIGWGILGCGDISEKRGAPAIVEQPDSALIAVCSRTAERARAFAERHGAARGCTRREDLYADADVSAIYVATEHYRHCEDTVAAAEAGKHVLVEKPMAMSVAECRRMIAACAANGVALQVAYYRRYYPKVRKMKELLAAGAIGEPVTGSIHLAGRLNPARIRPENWRLRAELSGGGALVDTGSHRLDILCYLLGEPARVAAFMECREFPIEAPDVESLLIRMACGTHVACRSGFRTGSPDEWELVGTRGTLSATPMDGDALVLRTGGTEERWQLAKHANVHYPLFDSFASRLARGEPAEFTGEDGLQTTRIIDGAYESARTGRIVDL